MLYINYWCKTTSHVYNYNILYREYIRLVIFGKKKYQCKIINK